MVPGRADPSLDSDLANWDSSPARSTAQVAARHARRSGLVRRLGALPHPRRREVLARLHRRQAQGRLVQGRAQLHRHRARDRRAVVRSGLHQFLGLRSLAVPRRRRHASGSSTCCGTTARGRCCSPASRCRNTIPRRASSSAERKNIFQGTDLKLVEGPHLYKRNGWYYLLTAEGGTGYEHACDLRALARRSTGRTRSIPKSTSSPPRTRRSMRCSAPAMATSSIRPTARPIFVHLMGRPTDQKRRCVLGRETGIQEAEWRDDGWLWVKDGPVPALEVDVPGTRDETDYWTEQRYSFDGALHKDFQWLRTPETDRIFTLERRQAAAIGRESIGSWFEQALVARRVRRISPTTPKSPSTSRPPTSGSSPGSPHYYGRYNFHYLTVTAHSDGKRELLIMSSLASYPEGRLDLSRRRRSPMPQRGHGAAEDRSPRRRRCSSSTRSGQRRQLAADRPGARRLAHLRRDAAATASTASFTGGFVGIAASDLNGTAREAAFSDFVYSPGAARVGSDTRPLTLALSPKGRGDDGAEYSVVLIRRPSPQRPPSPLRGEGGPAKPVGEG